MRNQTDTTMATKTATTPRPKRAAKPRQLELALGPRRGGRRRNAGRPPNNGVAGVGHGQRAVLAARHPVHVTLKLKPGLPRLRQKAEYAALRAAFVAAGARGATTFRICHFAVLNDHLHLIVEAQDRNTLSRALQGLLVRIARALNRLWRRRGSVFADRYHDEILTSPSQVRNAIRYVLGNAQKHAAEGRMVSVPQAIDTYSSAPWFDGFVESITVRGLDAVACPVASPRTWLLGTGWRRHGLLAVYLPPAAG